MAPRHFKESHSTRKYGDFISWKQRVRVNLFPISQPNINTDNLGLHSNTLLGAAFHFNRQSRPRRSPTVQTSQISDSPDLADLSNSKKQVRSVLSPSLVTTRINGSFNQLLTTDCQNERGSVISPEIIMQSPTSKWHGHEQARDQHSNPPKDAPQSSCPL